MPPTAPDVPASPQAALREVSYWLDRSRADSRRSMAYRRAADAIDALAPERYAELVASGRWTDVTGIGPKTAAVVGQVLAGELPDALARARTDEPLATGGEELREALRGDLHVHTRESDGSAPLEEMAETAARLGHEYVAITDHSPRLTVAHGLSEERLLDQCRRIDALGDSLGVRVLKGIEVDINLDGSLDQSEEALAALDVVVASVHSHLRDESEAMTVRMVGAIANPRTNVLGHCTGRLVEGGRGTRPQSAFDAEVVFEACRQLDVAVEINSRPERQDPPDDLLGLALDMGCLFAIDTDSHAPGQLPFLEYGCARAAAAGVPPERVINTWPVDRLIEFCGRHG